jgi:hypothetical protein
MKPAFTMAAILVVRGYEGGCDAAALRKERPPCRRRKIGKHSYRLEAETIITTLVVIVSRPAAIV